MLTSLSASDDMERYMEFQDPYVFAALMGSPGNEQDNQDVSGPGSN